MTNDGEVRRLALSCMLLGFVGETPPAWLRDALAGGLGGVVLFGSNLGDGSRVDELTDALRKAAGRDIVIALDEEGGDVTRLDTVRGSPHPGAAALGRLDEVAATEECYAALGARLAGAGVTLNLAPVADVNLDPRNPVIGVRSFGADPQLVARHVAAAVRGIQRAGVAACAKHFPGHGATVADSHHEVARLDRSRVELEAAELAPFSAAIAADARAVMTGHLLVPSLDERELATVSTAITHGLLRDTLGFDGTVVTDALEMRAVAATIGMVDGFVRSLAAGADTIETGAREYPDFAEAAVRAARRALDAGTLTYARLAEASRRTAALAAPGDASTTWDKDLVDAAPARCVEVQGALPSLVRPLVVEARPPGGMASGELPWSLADPLAELVDGVDAWQGVAGVEPREVTARAHGRSLVVVVRDPQRHSWQQALIDIAERHGNAVVVDVGWPDGRDISAPVLRTRGVSPTLMSAAARRLAGA